MNPAGDAAARARLVEAVQTNCHIADARQAADLTLCTYLLQMREFYRWERGLPFGAALSRPEVGAWIAEREALWEALEAQPFRPLCADADGRDGVDPFDVDAVNARLQGSGLFYGAGAITAGRMVFFLAEQHGQGRRDGLPVWSTGRELARGLAAPPAVLAGGTESPAIVLRRESMARWCWEKVEGFAMRPRPGSAMHAVLQAYALDADFEAALPRWLDDAGEVMVLHELGEHRAGAWLGPGWRVLREALPTRRGELHARALRDHLADFMVTLPTLLQRGDAPPLHIWFANYDGLRQQLHPSLPAAYAAWRAGDGGRALATAVARGRAHFEALARRAIDRASAGDADAGPAAEAILGAPDAVCPA